MIKYPYFLYIFSNISFSYVSIYLYIYLASRWTVSFAHISEFATAAASKVDSKGLPGFENIRKYTKIWTFSVQIYENIRKHLKYEHSLLKSMKIFDKGIFFIETFFRALGIKGMLHKPQARERSKGDGVLFFMSKMKNNVLNIFTCKFVF